MKMTVVVVLALACCINAVAQSTKTDDEIKAEKAKAAEMHDKSNFVGALPLYEELHQQLPTSTFVEERLGMCLLGNASTQEGEQALATRRRAKELLLLAQAGGDNSPLLQTLLEKLGDLKSAEPVAAKPMGYEWMQKAETAFSSGDLRTAIGLYKKAYEENPKYYAAALFAGDAEFKLDEPVEAGKWFAIAIGIDPDIETAYRYWGDTLEKAGEHQRAEEMLIKAIIADPYSKSVRLGLKQWADRNHAMIVPPPIKLPARATKQSNGNINITMPFTDKKDDPETSMNLIYSIQSATWQGDEFKKHFPEEKVYRHSLVEEAESIRSMLTVAKELKISEKNLSTSTKLLMELDKKGMLESFILLDDPDNGIAKDYVAYRKDHRDVMAKYVAEYDVHQM